MHPAASAIHAPLGCCIFGGEHSSSQPSGVMRVARAPSRPQHLATYWPARRAKWKHILGALRRGDWPELRQLSHRWLGHIIPASLSRIRAGRSEPSDQFLIFGAVLFARRRVWPLKCEWSSALSLLRSELSLPSLFGAG